MLAQILYYLAEDYGGNAPIKVHGNWKIFAGAHFSKGKIATPFEHHNENFGCDDHLDLTALFSCHIIAPQF